MSASLSLYRLSFFLLNSDPLYVPLVINYLCAKLELKNLNNYCSVFLYRLLSNNIVPFLILSQRSQILTFFRRDCRHFWKRIWIWRFPSFDKFSFLCLQNARRCPIWTRLETIIRQVSLKAMHCLFRLYDVQVGKVLPYDFATSTAFHDRKFKPYWLTIICRWWLLLCT